MTNKETIYLTIDQALEAICIDFRQYDPQMLLFCEIIRLVSGGATTLKRKTHKDGAWIRVAGRRNMRWLDGPELVEYVCEVLASADLNPELLASISSRVFRTRALPAVDPESGSEGIRIESGMETFHCRQCGHCCRSLDYRNEVTAEDVARWQAMGRTDILKWVGVFERDGREATYRIWMIPGTRRLAAKCPFLEKKPSENRWGCRIHDVKPAICRHYPASRKHAIMTGCPGFKGQGNR